jgi:hypothetical protein
MAPRLPCQFAQTSENDAPMLDVFLVQAAEADAVRGIERKKREILERGLRASVPSSDPTSSRSVPGGELPELGRVLRL